MINSSYQISLAFIRSLHHIRYKILTFVTLLGCAMLIHSCGHNSGHDVHVLRYNHTNPVTTLDPAFAKSQNAIWVAHHIYSTLFNFGSSTTLENNLVDRYDISTDGMKYTIKLQDSILFHPDPCFGLTDTRMLTSADVKYSLERLIDEELQSPGSWVLKGRIASIVVIDSLSLSITLIEPFAPFLGLLATKYCAIVPHEAVEYYGRTFRSHPVGTGPFKLKRWIEGEVLYLEAFDQYFKGKPAIDGVKASYILDKKIAFLSLLHGDLDYISGLESTFTHKLLDADGNLLDEIAENLSLRSVPYLNTEYIGINLNQPESVLSQKSFRQALNYAVDRPLLLKTLRNNIGLPGVNGFVHPGLKNMIDTLPVGYRYNPDKAKTLVEESGYHSTYGDEEITISTNADYLDIITFVARQWEAIGVKVQIEVLESSILRQGMRNGDISMFRASWIADYPDPENFLTVFYGLNPAPPNYTRMRQKAFDTMYEEAKQTIDEPKKRRMYTTLDAMIIDEAPVVFLFYDASAIFYSNRLKNVEVNALNYVEVENLSISDD